MAEPSVMGSVGKYAAMGATVGSAFPGLGTAIGAAAGAIIGGVTGFIQKRKAKRAMEEANKIGAVPEAVLKSQREANERAKQGMPGAQYAQATRNIQRQQNYAMSEAQDRRGGLMKVSQVNQGANDANLNLDATSAQMRVGNQRYADQINNLVGTYQQRRGERDWNYAMTLMGAANQNISNAADQGASAIGYGLSSMGGRWGNRGNTGNAMIGMPSRQQWGVSDSAINQQFYGG